MTPLVGDLVDVGNQLARELTEALAERDALRARVAELEERCGSLSEDVASLNAIVERLESPPVVPEGMTVGHDPIYGWSLCESRSRCRLAYFRDGSIVVPAQVVSWDAVRALDYAHRTNQRPPHAGDADG